MSSEYGRYAARDDHPALTYVPSSTSGYARRHGDEDYGDLLVLGPLDLDDN